MSIVRVKTKYQVTLPAWVRRQAGVKIGDILDAQVEKGQIVLTFKDIVDRRLALAVEDVRAGRTYGPFKTAEEMIASLEQNVKKLRNKK